MTKTVNRYAAFESILIEVDEPILVLLRRNAGRSSSFFMASAMPSDDGELDYYFVVSVKPAILKKYLRGLCDLRYLFAFAADRKYYKATQDNILSDRIKLVPFEDSPTENHLPSPQLFSSSHNVVYKHENVAAGEETLFIDGEWEMPEFGEFYTKYADIYGFMASTDRYLSGTTVDTELSKIEEAFKTKPFRGGSSYLGFFSDLNATLPHQERPSLEKIRYASPGEVDLRGSAATFSEVERLLKHYLENVGEITKLHDDLRKFMKELQLLQMVARLPTLDSTQNKSLRQQSKALYSALGSDRFDHVYEITGKNLVVTSKIGLALYRRISVAGKYFAQGRMAFSR